MITLPSATYRTVGPPASFGSSEPDDLASGAVPATEARRAVAPPLAVKLTGYNGGRPLAMTKGAQGRRGSS